MRGTRCTRGRGSAQVRRARRGTRARGRPRSQARPPHGPLVPAHGRRFWPSVCACGAPGDWRAHPVSAAQTIRGRAPCMPTPRGAHAPAGALEVPAHPAPRPALQLLVDVLAHVHGLQPQRVAAEVDARRRVGRVRVDHRVVEELAPRHRVRGICPVCAAPSASSRKMQMQKPGGRGRAHGGAGAAGRAPSLAASAASSTSHPAACACPATHPSASSWLRKPPMPP